MSALKSFGRRTLWVAGLLTIAAGSALAQSATQWQGQVVYPPLSSPGCVRPATPACIDDLTTYVSADKMVACQNAVQDFTTAMGQYQSCRGSFQDVPAGEEMVASIGRFNCRLQGGGACN